MSGLDAATQTDLAALAAATLGSIATTVAVLKYQDRRRRRQRKARQ